MSSEIPPVFGPNTDILAALAPPPLRRVNLQERFGETRIASLINTAAAGLTATWALPNLRLGRGSGLEKGDEVDWNPTTAGSFR